MHALSLRDALPISTPASLRSVQRPGKFSGTPDRNAIKSRGTLIGYREKTRRGVFSNAIDVAALIRLPPQDQRSFSCGWNQPAGTIDECGACNDVSPSISETLEYFSSASDRK